MLYELELGINDVEATKKICCTKGESALNYNNQMVEKILLGLQEPRWSGKIRST